MSHGHSWLSIKQYTLAEIGIFYRQSVLQERENKSEFLSNIWIGSNAEQKDLVKILKEINPKLEEVNKDEKRVSPKKANAEWRRLAAFMRGKK